MVVNWKYWTLDSVRQNLIQEFRPEIRNEDFELTFVLVGLGIDAEDGHYHDDDDNGGGRQSNHKPGLTVEGLFFEVTILQVDFGRGLNLI